MSQVRFLTGKPALLAGKSLVIADLHIGIEREFRRSGIRFPSQTEKITERIDDIIKSTGAKRLVILGDVKHKVPGISLQELREIPEFLGHFSKKLDVEIVMGNHDPGIEELAPHGAILRPSTGFRLDGVYLSHGHTWPNSDFTRCGTIVIGHQHPLVEFRDKLGYRFREPVWVRGKLSLEKIERRYKQVPAVLPEVIVMPAFNELSGGVAMNGKSDPDYAKNFISPLMKALDEKTVGIYLLDGTYLGKLAEMKKARS